jgi:hypothetical protein
VGGAEAGFEDAIRDRIGGKLADASAGGEVREKRGGAGGGFGGGQAGHFAQCRSLSFRC